MRFAKQRRIEKIALIFKALRRRFVYLGARQNAREFFDFRNRPHEIFAPVSHIGTERKHCLFFRFHCFIYCSRFRNMRAEIPSKSYPTLTPIFATSTSTSQRFAKRIKSLSAIMSASFSISRTLSPISTPSTIPIAEG